MWAGEDDREIKSLVLEAPSLRCPLNILVETEICNRQLDI